MTIPRKLSEQELDYIEDGGSYLMAVAAARLRYLEQRMEEADCHIADLLDCLNGTPDRWVNEQSATAGELIDEARAFLAEGGE